MEMKYYVLLGGPEHLPFFERNAALAGHKWFWTMVKSAKVGDTCFVYMSAPVSRIVGLFKVVGEPFFHVGNTMFDNPQMRDQYVAEIGGVKYFQPRPELTMKGLRELFPEWGWLRYPRSKTSIPDKIVVPFLEMVG
jgi:hypothetical protein